MGDSEPSVTMVPMAGFCIGGAVMGIGSYYEQEKYHKLARSGAFPEYERYYNAGKDGFLGSLTRSSKNALAIGLLACAGYGFMYHHRVVKHEISLFQYERFRGAPTYVYLNLPLYMSGCGTAYCAAYVARGGYVRFMSRYLRRGAG